MYNDIMVSVIVSVYNHEKYLSKALDSILMQRTDFKFEVLIGEDASSDSSRKILEQYEQRYPGFFNVFYRNKNLGATKNSYDLLKKAEGKYIASLDGDDYWLDGQKLQKQVEYLESNSYCIGVAGNFVRVDADGNILNDSCIDDRFKGKFFLWKDFLKYGFVFQTGTLVYRNFWNDGGDYSILYKAHELVGDLTVLTILLNRGKIFILPDVLSVYRMVLSPNGTNACSIGFKNPAISAYKTTRQYVLLNEYVTDKKNYDEKICVQKALFLLQMLKGNKNYTWSLFWKMLRLGSWKTHWWFIIVIIRAFRLKTEKILKLN